MKPRTRILLAGIAAWAAAGCGSYAPIAVTDNFAYLYGKGAAAMRLDARLNQAGPAEGTIYFRLRTEDLLYKGTGGGGPYHARVAMSYKVFPALGSKQLLDSASTLISDQRMGTTENKELIGSMPLQHKGGDAFVLALSAHDLNRDAQSTVIMQIPAWQQGSARNYLPLDGSKLPLFSDFVPLGGQITVEAESLAGKKLEVAFYPVVEQLPAPVFVNAKPPPLDRPAANVQAVEVDADGRFSFTPAEHGFYHFRSDTAQRTGYTLFVPDGGFPYVSTSADMLSPLRYITSSKEWEAMASAPDTRTEIERFWTDAAGSRDRAREAIAAYYGRVESANRHFSSYTEGWRTDRGLVHIIFGTPTTIRKDDRGETWIYGDDTNLMSLAFSFRKRDEPFSDNDLVLQRDPALKSAWYRNVESWRNGRILQY